MGDSSLNDTASLLARLEAAISGGEAAAARLDMLAAQHRKLDTEARATIATLDRLIAAVPSDG